MRGDVSDGGSSYARTQTSMSGASSITSLGACVFDRRRQQRTYRGHGNANIPVLRSRFMPIINYTKLKQSSITYFEKRHLSPV